METKNTSNSNKNKRVDSTIKYIEALQEKHSKLNVIRVDLAYKKPYSADVTLDEATKDFNRMMNNRRSKPSIFKDQVGFICKKEYTKDKGVHLHGVFLYDGQKILKDSHKSDQIGEYWNNEITQGKGSYHNCNRKKNEYEKNGIGMLEHSDSEKRKNLDIALSYLCKDEQTIDELKTSNKDRAFTRGTMPKSKGNMGRPRKKSVEE